MTMRVRTVIALALALVWSVGTGALDAQQRGGSVVHGAAAAALSRPVGVDLLDLTLPQALLQLRDRARLPLAYSPSLIPGDLRVDCACRDLSGELALRRVLEGTGLRFTPFGAQILIEPGMDGDPWLEDGDEVPGGPVEEVGTVALGSFRARVLDRRTLAPVPAVQYSLAGQGGVTGGGGGLVVDGVPVGTHYLRIRRLGYRAADQPVEVPVGESGEATILLDAEVMALNEVVVTGTPGGERLRAVGNEVARVRLPAIRDMIPGADLQDVVATRAPGVNVLTSSGNVGSGGPIRIRGVNSFTLDGQPLVYVDGIRVDNGQAGPDAMREDRPVNRLNDFNPDEIESIEIIKGPAAATLYGTEASAGVIQILTRRGVQGGATVDVVLRAGVNFLLDPAGRLPKGYRRDPETGRLKVWSLYHQERGDPRYFADAWTGPGNEGAIGLCHLRGCEPFTYGPVTGLQGSVSGGSGRLRYFVSAHRDDAQGYIWYNQQDRQGGRANLDISLREGLTAGLSLGVMSATTRFAQAAPPYGLWDAVVWGHSERIRSRGWYTAPGEELEKIRAAEEVDRRTVGVHLDWQLRDWLSSRLTLGADVSAAVNTRLVPRQPEGAAHYFGELAMGDRQREHLRTRYRTLDYALTASWRPTANLRLDSSAGFQHHARRWETISATGRLLASFGVSSVGAAAVTAGFEDRSENKTVGLFVQQQVNWKDRLYVTAAVRADDNSAFGREFSFVTYPKLGISWVLLEEPWWRLPALSHLRLRGAWGQAGKQPDLFASVQLYDTRSGPGGEPVVTPGNVGNPGLRPERGEEVELGVDAGFLRDRVTLSVSAYHQQTHDAILERQLPLSQGFPGSQYVNLGLLRNRGLEVALDADVLDAGSLRWSVGGSFSLNENRVLDLGGIPPEVTGYTEVREGYPVHGYWKVEIVDAEPDGSSPVCRQEDGSVLSCAVSAPRLYQGPQFPVVQGALRSTLGLPGNVRLFATLDYKGRYHRGDGDVGHAHMLMVNTQATVGHEDGRPPDPVALAYLAEPSTWGRAAFIHRADFVRLRELSATYTLSPERARQMGATRASVTLAARNLWFLWRAEDHIFGRPVVDPETRRPAPFVGQTQTHLPAAASLMLVVRVSL
jgi:outer membrane receptor protein involved in Fe transport